MGILMGEVLHLIDMVSGRPRLGIVGAARMASLAWSADSALLAVEGLCVGQEVVQHAAWVVDATTGTTVRGLGPIEVEGAQWSPVGSLLAAGLGVRSATIWEAGTGMLRHRLEHPDEIGALAWAPIGAPGRGGAPVLASGCDDGVVRLWNGLTGDLLTSLRTGAAVRLLGWEPGPGIRRLLAVGFWDRPAQVWDAHAGRLLGEMDPRARTGGAQQGAPCDEVDPGADHLVWAAPGMLLTELDRRIVLWNVGTGRSTPIAERGRWNDLADLHPTPDGLSVLDGRGLPLRLCDARTLEPRHELHGPALRVCAVAWSPDSSTVMAGGADGAVRMWEAASGAPTAWVVTGLPGGRLLVRDCAGTVVHEGPPPAWARLPDADA